MRLPARCVRGEGWILEATRAGLAGRQPGWQLRWCLCSRAANSYGRSAALLLGFSFLLLLWLAASAGNLRCPLPDLPCSLPISRPPPPPLTVQASSCATPWVAAPAPAWAPC
jgi:hypothetical protein